MAMQGFAGYPERWYDWSYAPERKGMKLCSACGPVKHSDGEATEFGSWHNQFPRTFLPKGMFEANRVGNIAHKESGDEDFRKFEIIGGGGVGGIEKAD